MHMCTEALAALPYGELQALENLKRGPVETPYRTFSAAAKSPTSGYIGTGNVFLKRPVFQFDLSAFGNRMQRLHFPARTPHTTSRKFVSASTKLSARAATSSTG